MVDLKMADSLYRSVGNGHAATVARVELANAQIVRARTRGETGELIRIKAALDSAFVDIRRWNDNESYLTVQTSRVRVRGMLAQRQPHAMNAYVEQGLGIAAQALGKCTRQGCRHYGMLHYLRAALYVTRARAFGSAADLDSALVAIDSLRTVSNVEDRPYAYAAGQLIASGIYAYQSEFYNKSKKLQDAIAAGRDVLHIYTPEHQASRYGAARLELCARLTELGMVLEDTSVIREAVKLGRGGMDTVSMVRDPRTYGSLVTNLGVAYLGMYSVTESKTARDSALYWLTRASALYDASRHPIEAGQIKANQMSLYRQMIESEKRLDLVPRVVLLFDTLASVFPDPQPTYAMLLENRGAALRARGIASRSNVDLEAALRDFMRARAIYNSLDYRFRKAVASLEIGLTTIHLLEVGVTSTSKQRARALLAEAEQVLRANGAAVDADSARNLMMRLEG
jgi:tetratricopeptide (TPR) repeat protein